MNQTLSIQFKTSMLITNQIHQKQLKFIPSVKSIIIDQISKNTTKQLKTGLLSLH